MTPVQIYKSVLNGFRPIVTFSFGADYLVLDMEEGMKARLIKCEKHGSKYVCTFDETGFIEYNDQIYFNRSGRRREIEDPVFEGNMYDISELPFEIG